MVLFLLTKIIGYQESEWEDSEVRGRVRHGYLAASSRIVELDTTQRKDAVGVHMTKDDTMT